MSYLVASLSCAELGPAQPQLVIIHLTKNEIEDLRTKEDLQRGSFREVLDEDIDEEDFTRKKINLKDKDKDREDKDIV